METKIQDLALKNLEEVQETAKATFPKIQNKFKYKKDDFQIMKKNRIGKSKFTPKFLSGMRKSFLLFGKQNNAEKNARRGKLIRFLCWEKLSAET